MNAILQHIRRLADRDGTGDGELLARFAANRDETAFATLMRRHGPLVLGVCQRVLSRPEDAEDAFQATFLVLVRQARSIRKQASVASWLYGVAYRVALKARAGAGRRRQHEQEFRDRFPTAPAPQRDGTELWPVVDKELHRLPDKYRLPLVLCYLQGRSHEEAARELGWPLGTVATRVARGRERLRRRLASRGLSNVGAALPAVVVPTNLAQATLQGVGRIATGSPVAMAFSQSVVSLAQSTMKAFAIWKINTVVILAAVGAIAAGIGLAWQSEAVGRRNGELAALPQQAAAPKAKPPAKAPYDTSPLTVRGTASDENGKLLAGATVYLVSTNGIETPLGTATTGPDGRYAFVNVALPLRDKLYGSFEIFGTAPGYAFAWCGTGHFTAKPTPPGIARTPNLLGLNEEAVMDLTFGPPASLEGELTDEAGKPVPGASVRIAGCDYLAPIQPEENLNLRQFWAIQQAPKSMTATKTDVAGRFKLAGLPREVCFWLSIEHESFARRSLYAATTDGPLPQSVPLVSMHRNEPPPPIHTGKLHVSLVAPRTIALTVVTDDDSAPAASVRIGGSDGMSTGSYSGGTTDARGRLNLRLPPGTYLLTADPPRDSEYVRTERSLSVKASPAEQTQTVRLNRGCVLLLDAVDADTGKGIPGTAFWYESKQPPGSWWQVQHCTWWMDNATTDSSGRLRAVVYPGTRPYRVTPPPGYVTVPEPDDDPKNGPGTKLLKCTAGKTITARFRLRRRIV